MCLPSGAMVGSLVVGITASIIGPSEKRPYFASSHAFSRYSRVGLIMISGCCGPSSLPGIAVRSGSSESAKLTLAEGLRFLKPSQLVRHLLGHMLLPDEREQRRLGVGPRDHHIGLERGAVDQGYAGCPAVRHVHGGDFGVRADLGPSGPGRGRYGLGYAPHPAAHEAPAARHTVGLAHAVVQAGRRRIQGSSDRPTCRSHLQAQARPLCARQRRSGPGSPRSSWS